MNNNISQPKIEIYDTSLRDGTQGEGVSLSLADKIRLTQKLDEIGVDYIEGGWPGSNPKDIEYFYKIKDFKRHHAKIVAFGSTHRSRSLPEEDFYLLKLIEAQADAICIFGKAWDLHVEEALRVPLDRNLEMISGTISYLKQKSGRPVFFDAEHFFDGFKANEEYTTKVIQSAFDAGADRIIFCDTNGGSLPADINLAVLKMKKLFPSAKFGIHVHNDGGLAVANTLAAIQSGCIQVQGTINGIGERCGNVDLISAIVNLQLKLGYSCLPSNRIKGLTTLSRFFWETINLQAPGNQAFVGKSAFAHKGGIHVSAVQRNSATYEHIEPEVIGNVRRILISDLSGGSNIKAKLAHRYQELASPQLIKRILDEIQNRENSGYCYEMADGSLDLLVRSVLGKKSDHYELDFYRVSCQGFTNPTGLKSGSTPLIDGLLNSNAQAYSFSDAMITSRSNKDPEITDLKKFEKIEATVKINIDSCAYHCVAEGLGPVDAINLALRKALVPTFPQLEKLHLKDFKVRVINGLDGTSAKVRVYIEHEFEGRSFGTIGVSENIIEASWMAIDEAYQYTLNKSSSSEKPQLSQLTAPTL